MVERPEPDLIPADEITALAQFLDYHRATLLGKVEGLTDEQARFSPVASRTSLMGLVRHMSEVERSWFERGIAGADVGWIYCDDEDMDRDFHPGPDDTLAEAVATYTAQCDLSRRITARHAADDEFDGSRGRRFNVRFVLLHMVEEASRHNGHADIIREMIDGATGE